MKTGTKMRNSNFELMRINSMLFIILFHVILHGEVIDNCNNIILKDIFVFIKLFTLVHVNSFILLTGYFQNSTSFKIHKLFKIIFQLFFYCILIYIVLVLLKIEPFEKEDFIKTLLPSSILFNSYWFIKYYIFLLFISPFLNIGIKNYTKKQFTHLLIVLFFLFAIIPTIFGYTSFENNGFCFYQFIYMYLIGVYLKKYPLKESYFMRRFSLKAYRLILLFIIFSTTFGGYLLYKTFVQLKEINSIIDFYSINISANVFCYNSILVVIQSIAYFCFFESLNIKNKLINIISSLTIGVYLIHDNNFIKNHLYIWLKINNGPIYSYRFLLYVFLITIFIFVVCSIIEFIRQFIFKIISKIRLLDKINDKVVAFIDDVYIKDF